MRVLVSYLPSPQRGSKGCGKTFEYHLFIPQPLEKQLIPGV